MSAKFPFPSVVFGGGSVITAPKIVTVTFPNDPLVSQSTAFGSSLTSSTYWTTVTAGLCSAPTTCVGKGTGSAVAVAAAPGSGYVDYQGGTPPSGQPANTLQPYLQGLINAFPAAQQPDANTVYVFYLPATTTITLDGNTSCQQFGGYHNSMTIGTKNVTYVIIPECPPSDAGNALTEAEYTTFAASHEILEAVSDPIIQPQAAMATPGGYYIDLTKQNSIGWAGIGDGELADLCVDQLGFAQDRTTDGTYTVQRIWSIANATAGNVDPCVPSNGNVYFNAFPTVSAVIVDVNQTTAFEVDALALGTEPTWSVILEDITDPNTSYFKFTITGGQTSGNLALKTANSGTKLAAQIKMLADPATIANGPGWGYAIALSLNGTNPNVATSGNYWPFIALTTATATKYGITMSEPIPPRVMARMVEDARARARDPRTRSLLLDRVAGVGQL